jgi:hypothetical protein
MYTREMTLKLTILDIHDCKIQELMSCIFSGIVFVPTVTMVASGSLVLINNTIHWVEYHGTCENGALDNFVKSFREKLNKTQITVP